MDKNFQQKERRTNGSGVFLLYTVSIFTVFSTFLFAIDFVPEKQVTQAHENEVYVHASEVTEDAPTTSTTTETSSPDSTLLTQEAVEVPQAPTQIIIESIGVHSPIIAPQNSTIDVLDRALLLGAVHYPGSAQLGEVGNMLLFGHSSHLPVVRNKAYKAFNDIHTLEQGDVILVRSETYEYVYEVQTVRMEKAQDAKVYFDAQTPTLTLATCDNFGSEEDRWIVTATQITKRKLHT